MASARRFVLNAIAHLRHVSAKKWGVAIIIVFAASFRVARATRLAIGFMGEYDLIGFLFMLIVALPLLWRELTEVCLGVARLLSNEMNPRPNANRRAPAPRPPATPRGPPPAKPYLLEVLPHVTVNHHDIHTHRECAMCKDDLQLGHLVVRLPCSHLYHDQCIEGWLLDKSCSCPLCLWEFPTDDQAFNRRQKERTKHRKPRYYWYELERTHVSELKQWLPSGDTFVAVEKRDLFQHLIDIQAIQAIDTPTKQPASADSPNKTCADVNPPSSFKAGQRVHYHKGEVSSQATILSVHLDGELEPFYTILVDGREKQTDDHHLSEAAQ